MRSTHYKYRSVALNDQTRDLCKTLAKSRSATESRFVSIDIAVRDAVESDIARRAGRLEAFSLLRTIDNLISESGVPASDGHDIRVGIPMEVRQRISALLATA